VRFLALFVVLVANLARVETGVVSSHFGHLILALVVLRIESNMLVKLLPYFLLMAAITLILHLLFNRTPSVVVATILGFPIRETALRVGLMYCWRILLFSLWR